MNIKTEEDLSLRAKILRQVIRMATSEKLLGPRMWWSLPGIAPRDILF